DIISTCMNLGLFVSINQRLDAETMALLADEFGYKVEFVSAELQEAVKEEEDEPDDLKHRPPIVTVMGHVDHGKTKLLDYIRNTNVIAGEAGGITQHIGAYAVRLEDGRQITFLDTPGHEAFTAMRARGAQVTDIAIIVVAADDGVMPRTVEAINHASAAGVPIIFAINKIDKPTANPDKVKEALANMNYLVEDWGGKFQSQEISAKNGLNVGLLLDKVLLEAEMLDLKANPDKPALGTVIESSLDKGRGFTATVLVKSGTLRIGDVVLAGSCFGHVKAMYNERGNKIDVAGPSIPVLILGLNGAPQAGDKFNVMTSDREAKDIATKRAQLQREQELRTQKHITLDEIGRRIAIGNFQELNIIVKGDFDGSVEALSDSLIKLSTPEIQLNIIHKAVGQISESDILLAAASNAIIVGFQVRPSHNARKLAEKEQIDIRLYSIIYDAIEEIKSAMEGMLIPEVKEEIVATLEIRETFKITKVGTIAGCYVKEGKISRSSKVRIIRDGIVIYTGELGSLKRFKDDAREVVGGLECGLNIQNFNDIKVGDVIEAYQEVEVKKNL
ncbi:MAG: translation initiation factor IF-2, partial [Bacteroidales bacterium]